jgi:hypothetical protein
MASSTTPNKTYDAPESLPDTTDSNHVIHQNDHHDAGDVERQSDGDSSSTHKQDGVQQVEALTTVWDDKAMIVMFIL